MHILYLSLHAIIAYILHPTADLVPGDFVHVIGDAHVYRNHISPLQDQLKKLPRPFPVSIRSFTFSISIIIILDMLFYYLLSA